MCFMLVFELFTSFDTFSLQCQLKNAFETSEKFNVIRLKGIYLLIFKVWEPKYIKVSNRDKFQFCVKVYGLKTYSTFKKCHCVKLASCHVAIVVPHVRVNELFSVNVMYLCLIFNLVLIFIIFVQLNPIFSLN